MRQTLAILWIFYNISSVFVSANNNYVNNNGKSILHLSEYVKLNTIVSPKTNKQAWIKLSKMCLPQIYFRVEKKERKKERTEK